MRVRISHNKGGWPAWQLASFPPSLLPMRPMRPAKQNHEMRLSVRLNEREGMWIITLSNLPGCVQVLAVDADNITLTAKLDASRFYPTFERTK